jgi:hypothetical protein
MLRQSLFVSAQQHINVVTGKFIKFIVGRKLFVTNASDQHLQKLVGRKSFKVVLDRDVSFIFFD